MLLLSALALASEVCPYGVNAHQASNATLEQAADAGIGMVRFDMNWNQFEPQKGQYDWSQGDRFMAAAEELGLQVFVTIAYTPDWAATVPCNEGSSNQLEWCHNAPTSADAYSAFVRKAVARYPSVQYWGLWNEPNLSQFYRGTRDQWAETILAPGSDAVHEVCSDCKVLGPELANLREGGWDADEGVCAFGECIFNGWNHSLEEILKSHGQYIDIITHHKYADPADAFWSEITGGQYFGSLQYMYGVQEITDRQQPKKPVWITEFGWQTSPGGEHSREYAAEQLRLAFDGFDDTQSDWPELEAMFWYDLADDPNTYEWGRSTWGLLDEEGNPKPAMEAYEEVIGGTCIEDEEPEEDPEDEPEEDPEDEDEDDPEDQEDPAVDSDPGLSDSAPISGDGAPVDQGCATVPSAGLLLALTGLAALRRGL